MSKELHIQNAVLGHFLTQWNDDESDHIKALIKSLVEIEVE